MDMDPSAPKREVLFEGLRDEQILNLPKEEVDQLILLGEPIVFRVGSAILLGSFRADSEQLRIELAQIEGGGEAYYVSVFPRETLRDTSRTFASRMDRACRIMREAESQASARSRTSGLCHQTDCRSRRSLLLGRFPLSPGFLSPQFSLLTPKAKVRSFSTPAE
jgi:hypothetical protein